MRPVVEKPLAMDVRSPWISMVLAATDRSAFRIRVNPLISGLAMDLNGFGLPGYELVLDGLTFQSISISR